MCVSIYTSKCNMQCLNNYFNILKVNDSTHVKMCKNSLNHSTIIAKYWVSYVLMYYNKCKMKFVNHGFNILKVNGSTLIIEEIWKKSFFQLNINVKFKIVTCVLINYGKCKMQLLVMVSTY
jgi:hypothetical protein